MPAVHPRLTDQEAVSVPASENGATRNEPAIEKSPEII
jgi:hypothetical protein